MTPIMTDAGFDFSDNLPLVRDALVEWLRQQGGYMHAMEFSSADAPRWNVADEIPESCALGTH